MLGQIEVLTPAGWRDYELLDSGDGMRLERFGAYTLARPDPEIMWHKRLGEQQWAAADAVFHHGEGGERWTKRQPIPAQWPVHYRDLSFFTRLTPFKHTGVFPEQAALWDWMREQLARRSRAATRSEAGDTPHVLTLFGYTGLAALTCASAGAKVTFVDASKWIVDWARDNQRASGLEAKPVRWIVDDALKFVRREARRGAQYDAIVLDPPSFGRGPKGEVWKFAESLPPLLDACRAILSAAPLFVVVTAYAVEVSALALANLLGDTLAERGGVSAGELVLTEKSGGRQLSTAIVARWSSAD